ncbi:DUF4383 domain-containing protein [Haloechinothrix salitolerans]|uniref:DUF4383 domain-containing protein n=1 Tax=Haloechinothrix salitolerans TaxID=926830 RepID=A0ABW2C058_9PSEU
MNSEPAMEQGNKSTAGAARSLAQLTSGVVGVVLVVAGILGFFLGDSSFTVGDNLESGELFGFAVNGWHNVVHIATGAFLLAVMANAKSAAAGLLVFGVVYGVVTVWGFITGDDILGLIPVDTADNILHAVLAVVAIVVAIASGGLTRRAA